MSSNNNWTAESIPDQTGRVAIVTGANSGIGYETARALAHQGATVIMACRNQGKVEAAAQQIQYEKPKGAVEMMQLDLGDLDSVRAFADEFRRGYDRLDLLINDAGIMHPPFGKTKQDFETQFGVNHLGHFLLTNLLLNQFAEPGRIIVVSSNTHNPEISEGRMVGQATYLGAKRLARPESEKELSGGQRYTTSKLCNLLFLVT